MTNLVLSAETHQSQDLPLLLVKHTIEITVKQNLTESISLQKNDKISMLNLKRKSSNKNVKTNTKKNNYNNLTADLV